MRGKLVITGLTLIGLAFASTNALAKAEYTKKEGKPCATCHTKAGDKALNETGTCYQGKKDLAACGKK